MSQTPQPIAQGDLQKSPLAHIVASLHRRAATGTLVIWPESGQGGQDRVYFEAGVPVAARALDPSIRSVTTLLERLADRARGAYAFYGEDLVGSRELTGAPSPTTLLRALVHATHREDGLERLLERRGDSILRVRRGLTPASLGLDREETEALDVLRAAPTTAAQFIERSGRAHVARRLLYLLELVDGLDVLDPASVASAPSSNPPPSASRSGEWTARPAHTTPERPISSPGMRAAGSIDRPASNPAMRVPLDFPEPPASLPEAERARWEELVARAKAEDAQNHYELLGVAPNADANEIEAAFVRLAKLVHPDRLGPHLAPLRRHADHLFRRATDARKILITPEPRAEYDRQVAEGGGSPASERRVRETVEAALDYQKVDLLLRKRAYDAALAIIDRNLELSPDVAEYPAKKAQVLFHRDGLDAREPREAILALLDRALALDPKHELANFVKGQALKKLGDPRTALAHFRVVVEVNPHNIDAARELRLASMKKGEASESLLGRLFKKKS